MPVFRVALAVLAMAFPLAGVLAEEEKSDTTVLIGWLLEDGRELKDIDFSEVLTATTGKKILPVDADADQPWLDR